MLFAIPFPAIDPIAIEIGPLAIRWYALAYVAGIVLGWRYALRLADLAPRFVTRVQIDDFIVWVTLGVVLGGRLGYVLFYKPGYYLSHPVEILHVWQGGMSFHGGMLGVVLATILFARRHRLPLLPFGDLICAAVPIGLFFGRIANFVNGELFGRVSDVSWAMVFPGGGPLPRHPSQLYQAALEGLVLFAILAVLIHSPRHRAARGRVSGAFLLGYGIARWTGELFREPDAHLGFLLGGATMGQLLSLPMILAGIGLIILSTRRPRDPA